MRLCLAFLLTLILPCFAFAAADTTPSFGSQPLSVIMILAALSLLPFVLVMITSFVRIVVVLSLLRSALGTPQIPPTLVITGLAIILTIYVMEPTGVKVWQVVQPVVAQHSGSDFFSTTSAEQLYAAAVLAKEPIRTFLAQHSSARDRIMFRDLARRMRAKTDRQAVQEKDLQVLIPAFVIGELAAAFQIGFLLFLPFIIIDMVVANVLLALGMHMLSPTTISLPFKLLLFVLVDGWYLITQGLVLSYV